MIRRTDRELMTVVTFFDCEPRCTFACAVDEAQVACLSSVICRVIGVLLQEESLAQTGQEACSLGVEHDGVPSKNGRNHPR